MCFLPTPESSVNSEGSQSSPANIPPYQPTGFWPTPQNNPYNSSSAPSMPAPFAQHQNLPTIAPQQQPRPQYRGYNLPVMKGPIMSNVHTPVNQTALVGGINMQYPLYQMDGLYGHHPGQQQQQSNRPFNCAQYSISFLFKISFHFRAAGYHFSASP